MRTAWFAIWSRTTCPSPTSRCARPRSKRLLDHHPPAGRRLRTGFTEEPDVIARPDPCQIPAHLGKELEIVEHPDGHGHRQANRGNHAGRDASQPAPG